MYNIVMKIAITGMGVISCCGNTVDDFWTAVINGQSGLAALTRFHSSVIKTKLVGQVQDFELSDNFSHKIRIKTDSHIQYALAAAEQAIAQSGLNFDQEDLYRIHSVIGTCSGSYQSVTNAAIQLRSNAPVGPTFLTGNLNNMISAYINMQYGLLGAGLVVNGACASGSQAIAMGAMLIETAQADVVIVGGTEDWINAIPISGLESIRALTYDPVGCKPFDQSRSGFSISEGAAVLILESAQHAEQRGAAVLAWLSGYGMSNDAYHPTAPKADGTSTRYMITQAVKRAGLTVDQIDYVNAHATGTLIGDQVEAAVLHSIFGDRPYLSGTKAVTGHSIGAVGAMEAIISVKVLQDQLIPATTNLTKSDCAGNHVIDKAISEPVQHVLTNSFGFGGTNGALVISRC